MSAGFNLYLKSPDGAWSCTPYSRLIFALAVARGVIRNEGWEAVIVDAQTGIAVHENGRGLSEAEQYRFIVPAQSVVKTFRFTVWVEANSLESATEAITNIVGYRDYDYDEDGN